MIRVPRWRHNAPVRLIYALPRSYSTPDTLSKRWRKRVAKEVPSVEQPSLNRTTQTGILQTGKDNVDPTQTKPRRQKRSERRLEEAFPTQSFHGRQAQSNDAVAQTARPEHDWASRGNTLSVSLLSTQLKVSDFDRLLGKERSGWDGLGLDVHQARNPETLEPLGRYDILFPSRSAAEKYDGTLRAAHVRAGLSEETVKAPPTQSPLPLTGHSDATTESVTESPPGYEDFTLAPGAQREIHTHVKRRADKEDVRERLAEIVKGLGFPVNSPLVLLDVYPPTLTDKHLTAMVQADSRQRGHQWGVSRPQALLDSAEQVKGISRREKLRGRFVMACGDGAEARRFHRAWNQRTFRGVGVKNSEDHLIKTSIIE